MAPPLQRIHKLLITRATGLTIATAAFLAGPVVLASSGAEDAEKEPVPIRPLPKGLRGPGGPNGLQPIPPGAPSRRPEPEPADAPDRPPSDAGSRATHTSASSARSTASTARAKGEEEVRPAEDTTLGTSNRQKPPIVDKHAKVTIDFVDTPLSDVVKYMADITGRNFILTDDLKGKITIISHQPVTVGEAYEAFLSALEMAGYTTVTVGEATKVVSTGSAANNPTRVYTGSAIPYTDNFVTQIIQLANVSVSDISSVVKELAGKDAKVIAYQPTNTLIVTDSATNIRRVYHIVSQLDVASPKSELAIIPLRYAQATEVQKIIEELYGATSSSSNESSSRTSETARRRVLRRRLTDRRRSGSETTSEGAQATSVGSEGRYIEKILADERTNSLILMANEKAIKAITALIAQLDVDVDPASRATIHVVYLEHAKAEDVAQVLANLSESGSSSSSARDRSNRGNRYGNRRPLAPPGGPGGPLFLVEDNSEASSGTSAVAAFDSGVRITSDTNTNSLVIIATPDQFRIIKQVIDNLDIQRKQVFVEAVILELASSDSNNAGLGFHMGKSTADGGLSLLSAQLGGSSLGLSASDILSGLAMGVFGAPVDVAVTDSSGETTTMSVPAFGIALDALQSNSAVNILSTPNVLTMDNEEAKIVVGRNIPFPVSTGYSNNNTPITSYQREDVAITLKVTPQINESNYVTLKVFQEVQEVESDNQGLDVNTAGFITSKRNVDTTVVVKDNQTVVLGGLIAETDSKSETKVPLLGDLPLVGMLFRGHENTNRKTNLLIFLTPHIIDDPSDLEEIYRVKMAQRDEFIRRFYGKSREQQERELADLLSYSMNQIDKPSRFRGPIEGRQNFKNLGGEEQLAPAPSPPQPIIIQSDEAGGDNGDAPDEPQE